MRATSRRFNLGIWGLAGGYFIFYLPYISLIKIIATGLWPGSRQTVSGFELLPAVVMATAVVLPLVIALLGWWRHASRREVFGRRVPWPSRWLFLSGAATAVIIGTTTLAYTFKSVPIVLAMVLLRAGVLVIAPAIDLVFKRRVRWFSWVALGLSMAALVVALADVGSYKLTTTYVLIVLAYLTGYTLRLPCMTVLAKSRDEEATRRYFVEEMLVAMCVLVAVPALCALVGRGEIMLDLRSGFTTFPGSPLLVPALLVGVCYAGLCVFGTLMYLDCREHTFCIPMNRCASILSGVVASYVLAALLDQPPPTVSQLVAAGLIVLALLFLSPLHHLDLYWAKLKHAGARLKSVGRVRPPAPVVATTRRRPLDQTYVGGARRVFLFVCSGNTCRSPMAEVIGNAEIAARLQGPPVTLGASSIHAVSAGVAADSGAPMTPEAQQTLQQLGFTVPPHRARSLTAELAGEAEKIYCMTQAHRRAVIELLPAAAEKTHCLDPDGDIPDPIGQGLATYLKCARHIRELIRLRLDELGLRAGLAEESS
ncbi:MAG TPA: hypothetical protein VF546_02570 [Pyrinomonadaceae bacterium]|jgi:protein-tyrosine-phosphatase/drug/metabolite transporter (DMT)-like permease